MTEIRERTAPLVAENLALVAFVRQAAPVVLTGIDGPERAARRGGGALADG